MALVITIGIATISFLFFLRWPTRGLALLFFLLPFSVALNPFPGFDLVLLRVLVPMFWFTVFLKYPKTFLPELKTRPALLLGLFLVVASLATFFAVEVSWALRKLLYVWSLTPLLPAIAALFKEKPDSRASLIKFLLAGGIVAALLGITQFILQFFFGTEDLFRFFAGLAPYLHGEEFGALIAEYPSWFVNIGGADYLRAFAFFPDPHMFAFYLVFVSSLALSMLLAAKDRKRFTFLAALYALFVVCLFLTFSRGGYLGFLASTIVVLALSWKKLKHGIAPYLVLVAAALFVLFIAGAPVVGRLVSSFDVAEGSNAGRIDIWRDATEKTLQHPFGAGLGNYAVAEDGSVGIRNPITAHNLYFDIAVETGLPGLVVFILLLVAIFSGLYRSCKTDNFSSNVLTMGFVGALVGFSTHAFFENPLWAPAIFVLLMLAAAESAKNP
ncbi:MAG: O-antigen ligase family protein [bacterium]|nr:O-antigen ligase family protein [bacterium]